MTSRRRRIAWAGPWNARSAIAAFGGLVVAELAARGHEVEVFRTETGELLELPPRPAPGPVSRLSDAPPGELAGELAGEYDAFVVNLGDHYGHHGAAIPVLLRTPALAVFHDAFLANLFNGWLVAGGVGAVAGPALAAVYGPGEAPRPFLLPLEEMAARRPMLEWFAALAGGAVAHANHYADRLRSACPGPVGVIPLAFEGPAAPPAREIGPEVVVATVGHVNPNKRVADMLRAMAASAPLRERVRYRLIGPAEPEERAALGGLARSLGVPEPEFTGWVDDADLPRRLAGVDVMCCLRNPVLEGASASLVLAMRSGRPVLVSDHGPYAEVPDGLVLKCRPGHEAVDLRLHLEALLADPAPARAMAARARAYAEDTFSPARYADALLAHMDRVAEHLPAVRAGMGLGRTLGGFGMAPDDPAGGRVADALDDLLDRRG